MAGDDIFQLAGIDLEAGDIDHFLAPVNDTQITLSVDQADIAGIEPAVLQCLAGFTLLVPIALHQLRPAHENGADLAIRQRPALLSDDAYLGIGQWSADAADADLIRPVDTDHR